MSILPSKTEFAQAVRRLAKDRGFVSAALLTLALCIGANATIFSVVDAVLIRALPFAEPQQLITTYNSYPGAGVERAATSLPNYYERKDALKSVSSLSIHQGGSAIVGEAGSPKRVERARVSPEFFETLGVPLLMGQIFTEDNMLYASSGVAVLTYEFWQSYFNGDPDVVSKTFQVDSLPVTVVGVLPQGFRYLSNEARFYVPAASNLEDREPNRRHSNNFELVARLAPGFTAANLQTEIDAFNEQHLATDPFAELVRNVGYRTHVKGLHADHVESIRPTLLLLQGGALCLLIIGAVNIANLLLVRASGQSKELAVRQALGAGRRHVAQQALIETVLLTLCGSALGLALGYFGIQLLDALGAERLPLVSNIHIDGRLAISALGLALIVGIALAAPIVWFNLHQRLATALQSESRSGTASQAAQRVRHTFIVAQIALAFTLLASAGLLTTSLQKVMSRSPGFDPQQVVTAGIGLPWKNYPNPEKRIEFVDRLLAETRAIPGVISAAVTTGLPFSGNNSNNATAVEGFEPSDKNPIRAHLNPGVAGDYWQTMGISLIEGRYLDETDAKGDTRSCLVDEALAKMYWPNGSAIGRRLANDVDFNEENAHTIVGVVATVRQNELADTKPVGTVYYPYRTLGWNGFVLVAKTGLPPDAFVKTLQKTILDIDPELPVDNALPMQERIDNSLVARRSPALLAALFAVVAVLLAGIGTYGVLAYAVSQRKREIGVRLALGARPNQIRNQFIWLGARLFALGAAIGALASWGVGRAMGTILFEVEPFNPAILASTVVIIGIVSIGACALPSRIASRTHPMEALSDA